MKPKKLILLAGGLGTRLSELTESIPKPAVSVCNKPLITYLIDWAKTNGFQEVIVCAGYRHTVLKQIIHDYYRFENDISFKDDLLNLNILNKESYFDNFSLKIIDTGLNSDTCERLNNVKRFIQDEDSFVVTYGDTLTNLKFDDLLISAKKTNKIATICAGLPDARYGEIKINSDLLVEKFSEKEKPKFYVNRGFILFKNNILDLVHKYKSIEHDLMPFLSSISQLAAYKSSADFHSVDTVKDLKSLEENIINYQEGSIK